MDPYDAVPAAARYLCVAGAGRGGAGLSHAVFAYNHSQQYVNSVLSLAQAYARHFS
jgi:membrane-bound lytic murein transglycosylase B